MDTLNFLISLKDKYTYFSAMSDLQVMIEQINKESFEDIYKDLNISYEEFLEKVKEDLAKGNKGQITALADYLISIYGNDANLDNPLKNILINGIRNYIIKNPNEINVSKYSKIIIYAVFNDIKKDLANPTLLYASNNKYFNAAVYSNDVNNLIEFNEENLTKGNNTEIIFNIYKSLYHEQYHCLVKELENNPTCYKVDILKYQIASELSDILSSVKDNKFYNFFYEFLKEENNANLYGIKNAKEKIMEINPSFKVSMVNELKEKQLVVKEQEETTAIKGVVSVPLMSQDAFFENYLDQMISRKTTKITGSLARMYNENGERKDFLTLVNDYKNALANNPTFANDINEYYSYLIYRIILKMNDEEIKNVITSEYSEFLINILNANKNKLNEEIEKNKNNKLYHIMNFYNNRLNRKVIKGEIKQIDHILDYLSKIEKMEEENKNARR